MRNLQSVTSLSAVLDWRQVPWTLPPALRACPSPPSPCPVPREAFHLFEFDIQEFEESLLLLGADDQSDQLVRQLVVKLLQGGLPMYRKRITHQVGGQLERVEWSGSWPVTVEKTEYVRMQLILGQKKVPNRVHQIS